MAVTRSSASAYRERVKKGVGRWQTWAVLIAVIVALYLMQPGRLPSLQDVQSMLTDPNILSIIVFLAFAAYLLWRDRENIERYSVIFVRRTKKGIHYLDEVARLNPRIWRIWSTVGIVVGFGLMLLIFVLVLHQTLKLFLVANAVAPVAPVLPTASTFTDPTQAGYLGIPFWYFLIGISVVMVVHEMMHGVIARVEDFDIEYVGLLLLAFIPGAFVQPAGQRDFFEPKEDNDDQKPQSPWDQGNWVSRLRVLAAGPWANVTLALVLGGILAGAGIAGGTISDSQGYITYHGMEIVNVSEDSPAAVAGLQPGMVATTINGNTTNSPAEFQQAVNGLTAGQTVTVETVESGSFTVTLGPRPGSDNATYRPALIDHLLPRLEQRYPGTIDTYEAYNNWIAPDDKRLEVARWEWIQNNYPSLDTRAQQRVQELEQQQEPLPGFMGIRVQPDMTMAGWLETTLPILQTLFLMTYVVALLNLLIGTANLLPVKGLDGGWMVSIFLERFAPTREKRVTRTITIVTLLMILISFIFLIARFLL